MTDRWERLLAWIVPDYPFFLLDHSLSVMYRVGPIVDGSRQVLYFESHRP